MKIILKSLSLINFKGVRQFSIQFNDDETNILGRNRAGKTTLLDAFLWLFFNKNSAGAKEFEIKTLDENNQPYHRLDHEVSGVILVDSNEITLRKTYKEKWTKKRGETTPEFTGHETVYYWNDVPCSQKEYETKIAALFNEEVFKLITNVNYFNSIPKWQDRRNILLGIVGRIDNTTVLDSITTVSNKAVIGQLTVALNSGKTLDEFKREISAKKKKIKDELILIPSRIDEAKRSMPEAIDEQSIRVRIQDGEKEIDSIDAILSNKSAATKKHQEHINELLNRKQTLHQQMVEIEFAEKNKIQSLKNERDQNILGKERELSNLKSWLDVAKSFFTLTNDKIKSKKDQQAVLRQQWNHVNETQLEINDSEFCCPTCKREFEPHLIDEKKDEMTSNFNQNKSQKLTDIQNQGKRLGEEIEHLQVLLSNDTAESEKKALEFSELQDHVLQLKEQHKRLCSDEDKQYQEAILANVEHRKLKSQIGELNAEINKPAPEEQNDELLSRKRSLRADVDQLKASLSTIEQRRRIELRITELTNQESTMAQELADLEHVEAAAQSFEKASMDMLEDRLNSKFELVKFKMFEQQINGGETPACITLVGGVPYPDVNTAGKIQAGVDIINTLSRFYDIYGPIWVDNRESVTELPNVESQLINLFVSAGHKQLTIAETVTESALA